MADTLIPVTCTRTIAFGPVSVSLTFEQWRDRACAIRNRADRVSRAIVDRARRVAREAGTSPDYVFSHAHNAMVCFESGRPWPGVDYSKVRLILRLERLSWIPGGIADRVIQRAWDSSRAAGRF